MLRRLRALPPVDLGLRMADAYGRYGVARSAAALSYFLVLTLFPLLMCANFLIGSLHLDLEQILAGLSQFLPTAALSTILDYLNYAAATQSSTLLLACLFTILMCASAGLRTLLQTMDDLFAAPCRDGLRRLILSFILSALFLPTMYLSVVVVLTGDWFFHMLERLLPRPLLELIPLSLLSHLWRWTRYLLLFCFVLLLVAAVYRLGIPKERVSRRGLWGFSAVTALAMVGSSAVFSWFIGMSSRYALVYGSLASLIILLVWLYFCGNILLLGAVLCSVWGAQEHRIER